MTLQTNVINQLADRIEACDEVGINDYKPDMGLAFTMRRPYYPCGSPACILGHNHAMQHRSGNNCNTWVFARDLGITAAQALELYAPDNDFASHLARPGEPGWITKAHAVAVLRHLRDTGEVHWSKRPSESTGAAWWLRGLMTIREIFGKEKA